MGLLFYFNFNHSIIFYWHVKLGTVEFSLLYVTRYNYRADLTQAVRRVAMFLAPTELHKVHPTVLSSVRSGKLVPAAAHSNRHPPLPGPLGFFWLPPAGSPLCSSWVALGDVGPPRSLQLLAGPSSVSLACRQGQAMRRISGAFCCHSK